MHLACILLKQGAPVRRVRRPKPLLSKLFAGGIVIVLRPQLGQAKLELPDASISLAP